jgi:predicted DNA-binding mobile mystery protein A
MRPVNRFTPPVRGLIRAIRKGLGMSSAQLAKRLGIKQPSVFDLEQSEMKGTIELATLRRVAQSLDCTLIFALVPNRPLETLVQDRARRCAAALPPSVTRWRWKIRWSARRKPNGKSMR